MSGLRAGGTGRAFLVTSAVLVAGVVLFGAAAVRSGELPVPAVVLHVAGMLPGSLRGLAPEPAHLIGLVVAAAGVAWMSVRLWSAGRAEPVAVPAGG